MSLLAILRSKRDINVIPLQIDRLIILEILSFLSLNPILPTLSLTGGPTQTPLWELISFDDPHLMAVINATSDHPKQDEEPELNPDPP